MIRGAIPPIRMEEWLATLQIGPLEDAVNLGVVDGTILDMTYPIVLVNPFAQQIGYAVTDGLVWHFRENGVIESFRAEPRDNYVVALSNFLNIEGWTMTTYARSTKPDSVSIIQKLVRG